MPSDFHTMNSEIDQFSGNLIQSGVDITQYDQNDIRYLLRVAKLCAKQVGAPLGATIGIATANVGAVTLPFVGAVPGFVAGFLAGAVGGTVACTISKVAIKKDLDAVLQNSSYDQKNLLRHRP